MWRNLPSSIKLLALIAFTVGWTLVVWLLWFALAISVMMGDWNPGLRTAAFVASLFFTAALFAAPFVAAFLRYDRDRSDARRNILR